MLGECVGREKNESEGNLPLGLTARAQKNPTGDLVRAYYRPIEDEQEPQNLVDKDILICFLDHMMCSFEF